MVIALAIVPVSGVLAATSQDVTVTAWPGYIAITNTPATWTINGISGNGFIAWNTTYYSNLAGDTTSPNSPVVNGDCYFSVNNTGSVNATITVNFSDFTGAGDNMTNSGDGGNSDNTFGAWSYHSGMTTYATDRVIAQSTGSDPWSDNLTPAQGILWWGLEILTRATEWTSTENMTSTVTITATLAP